MLITRKREEIDSAKIDSATVSKVCKVASCFWFGRKDTKKVRDAVLYFRVLRDSPVSSLGSHMA